MQNADEAAAGTHDRTIQPSGLRSKMQQSEGLGDVVVQEGIQGAGAGSTLLPQGSGCLTGGVKRQLSGSKSEGVMSRSVAVGGMVQKLGESNKVPVVVVKKEPLNESSATEWWEYISSDDDGDWEKYAAALLDLDLSETSEMSGTELSVGSNPKKVKSEKVEDEEDKGCK